MEHIQIKQQHAADTFHYRAALTAKHHSILCDMSQAMKEKKIDNLTVNIEKWEKETEIYKYAVISGNGGKTQLHVGPGPRLGHEMEAEFNKTLRELQTSSNGVPFSAQIMIQEMCAILQSHVSIIYNLFAI